MVSAKQEETCSRLNEAEKNPAKVYKMELQMADKVLLVKMHAFDGDLVQEIIFKKYF